MFIRHSCTLKASSHIDDTTRQHATRPVFSLLIQSNGSVHTYAARPSLVVTTKSCDNKNWTGSDFSHVSQRQYKKLLKKTVSIVISPGLINL